MFVNRSHFECFPWVGQAGSQGSIGIPAFSISCIGKRGEEGSWCIGVHSKEGGGSKMGVVMVGRILETYRIWKGCLDRMFHRIGFKKINYTDAM